MANLVAIAGESGQGKTTSLFPCEILSIKGLNPKETVIINISGKSLPVKGADTLYPLGKKLSEGSNHIITEDSDVIAAAINYVNASRLEIKNLVIDDAGYTMGLEVIAKAKSKGFDKWTDLAVNHMKIINAARACRSDLNIIFIYHQEKNSNGTLKIKTAGAMIDNNILIDGLFTTILYTEIQSSTGERPKYQFRTHGEGNSTCKSPVGCFEEDFIPNDMGYVIEKLRTYYN